MKSISQFVNEKQRNDKRYRGSFAMFGPTTWSLRSRHVMHLDIIYLKVFLSWPVRYFCWIKFLRYSIPRWQFSSWRRTEELTAESLLSKNWGVSCQKLLHQADKLQLLNALNRWVHWTRNVKYVWWNAIGGLLQQEFLFYVKDSSCIRKQSFCSAIIGSYGSVIDFFVFSYIQISETGP